jgi:L-ornithine Nalpha-acyltransferase
MLLTTASAICIATQQYEVTLAKTFAEIDAALRLRFEVFNLELNEGLSASYERGFDRDAYDAWCDHLIVKERASRQVVGTYRLLRQSIAERNLGFYSENEFNLDNLKRLPGEALELGRSCVAAEHRSFAVINLLWSALTHYALTTGIARMFGCASLHAAGAAEVHALYRHLSRAHLAPPILRVTPQPTCRLPDIEPANFDERELRRRIPPLLKGYLRAGAVVCGEPAFDVEFGTADVLVLLEATQMSARYQQHYLAEERQGV